MSAPRALDRRELLAAGAAGLGAAACAAAGEGLAASGVGAPRAVTQPALARPAAETGRALVVLEMFGGNDGLSTLVPHQDDAYHRARPTLRFRPEETLRVTDERGLHPTLENLHRLYHAGRLAAVEGVGFPAPVYSHFRSQEIWHTARREGRASGPGWLARVREGAWGDDPDRMLAVHIGGDMPYSMWSERHPAISFRVASDLEWLGTPEQQLAFRRVAAEECTELARTERERMLEELRARLRDSQIAAARLAEITESYRPRSEYPPEPFAAALRSVAALLDSDARTRIYSVVLSNFDTHGAVQRTKHARLLAQLDRALGAFFADLQGTAAEQRVLVLCWSEFGRRVAENVSHGTDHGAAGPALLLGAGVRGGLHGQHPSVSDVDGDGNLVHTTDFRRVYATCLERWLGVPATDVLGGRYAPLPILG